MKLQVTPKGQVQPVIIVHCEVLLSLSVIEESIEVFSDVLLTAEQAGGLAMKLNIETLPSLNLTKVSHGMK